MHLESVEKNQELEKKHRRQCWLYSIGILSMLGLIIVGGWIDEKFNLTTIPFCFLGAAAIWMYLTFRGYRCPRCQSTDMVAESCLECGWMTEAKKERIGKTEDKAEVLEVCRENRREQYLIRRRSLHRLFYGSVFVGALVFGVVIALGQTLVLTRAQEAYLGWTLLGVVSGLLALYFVKSYRWKCLHCEKPLLGMEFKSEKAKHCPHCLGELY